MPKKNSAERKRDRLVAEHKITMARIRKWRSVALFLGLVPFAGLTACDVGLSFACIQREIYLGMWAAIVGAVVGLSIRLVLERRRFQQQTPPG
jgi:hypothetical protein